MESLNQERQQLWIQPPVSRQEANLLPHFRATITAHLSQINIHGDDEHQQSQDHLYTVSGVQEPGKQWPATLARSNATVTAKSTTFSCPRTQKIQVTQKPHWSHVDIGGERVKSH